MLPRSVAHSSDHSRASRHSESCSAKPPKVTCVGDAPVTRNWLRPAWPAILVGVLLLAGTAAPPALAQESKTPSAPNDAYSIPWYTIDGGGGTSTGGLFALQGTAGQPEAGTMTGGPYTLTGGFWTSQQGRGVWVPLVIR
jgi:hypothetical protein